MAWPPAWEREAERRAEGNGFLFKIQVGTKNFVLKEVGSDGRGTEIGTEHTLFSYALYVYSDLQPAGQSLFYALSMSKPLSLQEGKTDA